MCPNGIETDDARISRVMERYSPRKKPKNFSMKIETATTVCTLTLLDERLYDEFRCNSVPIFEDRYLKQALGGVPGLVTHRFCHLHVTLLNLFGETGDLCKVSWRESHITPFLVSFERDGKPYDYLMAIYNYINTRDVRMSKMIRADDRTYDRDAYHEPFDDFPRSSMRTLITYFICYLTGYFKEMQKWYATPFFRTVPCDYFIFGYKDGRFFNRKFSGDRSFYKGVERMEEYMATVKRGENVQGIDPFHVSFVCRALAQGETEERILRWVPLAPEEFERVRRFLHARGAIRSAK